MDLFNAWGCDINDKHNQKFGAKTLSYCVIDAIIIAQKLYHSVLDWLVWCLKKILLSYAQVGKFVTFVKLMPSVAIKLKLPWWRIFQCTVLFVIAICQDYAFNAIRIHELVTKKKLLNSKFRFKFQWMLIKGKYAAAMYIWKIGVMIVEWHDRC